MLATFFLRRGGVSVSFVQTIAYTTSKPDDMRALGDEFNRENPTSPGLVNVRVFKDRDRENSYLLVAEFESYEQAMENSGRPEVDALSKRMAELADAAPVFTNYDVIQEM